MPSPQPKQFLSLSSLARRCDVSAPRASRLVSDKIWIPDGQLERTFVFDAARLSELKAAADGDRKLKTAA